ncbi:MAG TPA: hypothetical protein VG890_08285 [Puia sp.]|nr:hypothetical protein [Puia sp.]
MIRRIFGNLYFLTFLNGFLVASIFYFRMEANYEQQLFSAIRANVDSQLGPKDTQDSVVVKMMQACHDLMNNRETVFEGQQLGGIKADLLHPTSIDLMTANGACGSFSVILARLLSGYDFPVRIAQMKANGRYAAHNIVEARTNHGWIVLDPLFAVYFIRPDKQLASFTDVKNNWNYFRQQLPPGYDTNYRYADVRYSNWSKIPVVLPAVKKILDLAVGRETADGISIRTYFLRKYDICFWVAACAFFFVFLLALAKLIQFKIFPARNIPLTFPNIFKYLRLRMTGDESIQG